MGARYPLPLSPAERAWLVGHVAAGHGRPLRAYLMALYLADLEIIEFFVTEDELWAFDQTLAFADPFHDKLADGKLLLTFAEKVWRPLAELRGPQKLEMLDAGDHAGPYDHADAHNGAAAVS